MIIPRFSYLHSYVCLLEILGEGGRKNVGIGASPRFALWQLLDLPHVIPRFAS